jgi:hypothetical protein
MVIPKEIKWFGFALLLVILIIMLFSAPDYQPYYKNIPYAKYEGFDVFSAGNTVTKSSTVSSDTDGFETLNPAYTNGQGGVYSENVNSVFNPVKGVVYGSKTGDSEHLDYFLDVEKTGVDGKDGCQSSGLSNSLGALCLTPDLIQQLKTRGGNATGN